MTPDGGTGRRACLKSRYPQGCAGSSPAWGTMFSGRRGLNMPEPGCLGGGELVKQITINGIRTAMRDHSSYNYHNGVSCPCGWRDHWCDWTIIGKARYDEILLFHFNNCPLAKDVK